MSKQTEIGYYGNAWMEFMEENHPKLVRQMKKTRTYEAVAQSVNSDACDYYNLLAEQYAQQTPPPEDPEAYRSWKYTRDYYIDSAVMREKVLVAVTTP